MSLIRKKDYTSRKDIEFFEIKTTLSILEHNIQVLNIRLALANLSNSSGHKAIVEEKCAALYKETGTMLKKLGEFKSFSTDAVAKRIEKLRKEILSKI